MCEKGIKPGILIWHHFCDLGNFWGDDLLTYILTLRLTPWIKLWNFDLHLLS